MNTRVAQVHGADLEHTRPRLWGGLPRVSGRRGRRLTVYFALLVVVVTVAAAAAVVYVFVQTGNDSRQAAARDGRFAAASGAQQLGSGIATIRSTVAKLATTPNIEQAAVQPTCALSFGPTGGLAGHVDVLRPDGSVACSSRPHSGEASPVGYEAAGWLGHVPSGGLLRAPILDRATGEQTLLVAARTPKHWIVAAFVALAPVGSSLAAVYGGGRPAEFLITSADGKTVVARSIDSAKWVGAPLAGTPFARSTNGVERRDVQGTPRLYEEATIPGVGWKLYVGEDKAAALAAGGRLRNRQLAIILAGLALVFLATLGVYRRVAVPIRRLGEAVRATSALPSPEPVAVSGPAEVVDLGEDVNRLIASVRAELDERVEAEEALRESEESYRLLFDRHPGPMWLFDVQTRRFLAVNDAAVASYGYSAAEFLAMTVDDVRPAEDGPALHEKLQALGRDQIDAGVWRHRTKDGSLLNVTVYSNTVQFGGRPARVVLALDITLQRELEEQLRQAQKMEAIGSLAAGIAHDFNNLLTVIRGYGGVLMPNLSDEKSRQALTRIDRAAEQAAQLTGQLLAFSRQQLLHPEVSDLNEVVQETLALLERMLRESIVIERALGPSLSPVLVDRSQVAQVILNLAVNARDAMPGGGTLAIETANVELDGAYAAAHSEVIPGRYVLLQVTDSGAGMDEETRNRVFDPFFTTKAEGTGLGLSTVFGIVKQTGGHIWLYSEPGLGTTFKIYFPATDAPVSRTAAPAEVGSLEGHETILLVEDNDMLRALVAEVLESYGYTVLTAPHGLDAVALAADERTPRIALLLTDVVMPQMSGREVAERLIAAQPGLRVLFTSGYPADTVIRHGIAAGHTAFIQKPYLADELARKIRALLTAT